jgi:sulfate/thiosulfate transport system substrate-binding protein
MGITKSMGRRILFLLALVAAVAGACSGSDDEATRTTTAGVTTAVADGKTLTLFSYSTPREPFRKLIEMFTATPEGEGVAFRESYGSSSDQALEVSFGLPADVVALSVEVDMLPLAVSELIPKAWKDDEYGGMVTNSVVAFVVRKANPLGIRSWSDLAKEGVTVITPTPFTSGIGRWNVLAAYGGQLERGRTARQAEQFLRTLFENVEADDRSAREALETFAAGNGDVLITSEAEGIYAQRHEEMDYVVPDETILIENPIAVTLSAPPEAQAFVDFLRAPAAQKVFGERGYRPVVESVAQSFGFPRPKSLFTIDELGSWQDLQLRFFDRALGIMARIYQDLGLSVEE